MDRDKNALHALLSQLGDGHAGFVGDVQSGAAVKQAIKTALNRFQQIHVIHNNAGIANPAKPLHETTEDEWDALMSVNLKSIYWTTLYGLDALKATKGCILNTSSLVGELGQSDHAAYTVTKGGVNALTKSMALDYAPLGIRVNAICPAGVWTPMLREWASQQRDSQHIESYLDQIHPLGYCPEADVIADAAVFLVSKAARFITGCLLPVGGGAELGYRR